MIVWFCDIILRYENIRVLISFLLKKKELIIITVFFYFKYTIHRFVSDKTDFRFIYFR